MIDRLPIYPPGSPDPKRILVMAPTWVGDFVMATPTLRAIRKRFTTSRITLLLEPNLLDLAGGGPWMDEVIALPARDDRSLLAKPLRGLVEQLRGMRFDCAILLSNSFRSALLARLAGIQKRIGYRRDGRGWLLSHRIAVPNRGWNGSSDYSRESHSLRTTPKTVMGKQIPARRGGYYPMPLVDYYAVLAKAIGCDETDDRLELFTTPDGDEAVSALLNGVGIAGPLVAISPGARFGASKCWPVEKFAATADTLIDQTGAGVLITCGPGEEPIARGIAANMKGKAALLDRPLLGLGELKSLLKRCDLLIANDAGPRHIAKAFGVRVVTVFGPTHPDWTATAYDLERIVRIDVDCGPCQQRVCPLGHHQCMEGVSVEMVVSAAMDLLRR